MKEGQYTKTLAKIQVGEIFSCEIPAEILICIIHRAYGDAMFVPLWVAPTWRQIHLLPSFATNAWIHHSRNSCVTQKVRNWRVLYLKTKSSFEVKTSKNASSIFSFCNSLWEEKLRRIDKSLFSIFSKIDFMWNVWGIFLKSLTLAWFPYRKKKKKKKKDNIYINTITLFRLSCLTSMGK